MAQLASHKFNPVELTAVVAVICFVAPICAQKDNILIIGANGQTYGGGGGGAGGQGPIVIDGNGKESSDKMPTIIMLGGGGTPSTPAPFYPPPPYFGGGFNMPGGSGGYDRGESFPMPSYVPFGAGSVDHFSGMPMGPIGEDDDVNNSLI